MMEIENGIIKKINYDIIILLEISEQFHRFLERVFMLTWNQ